MIEALLYDVSVRFTSRTRAEITLVPNKLGRLLRRRVRVGFVRSGPDNEDGEKHWWWITTDRYVGWYVERYIEAAPLHRIEDMSVEQLLGDGSGDDKH
jgi:hypothetical protein